MISLALGLASGALYEIYEWAVDHWFGGTLMIGESDTVRDLAMDTLGSAIGGLLLGIWAHYGWQTTRRVPSERIS